MASCRLAIIGLAVCFSGCFGSEVCTRSKETKGGALLQSSAVVQETSSRVGCWHDNQCGHRVCVWWKCKDRQGNGAGCSRNAECRNNRCHWGKCKDKVGDGHGCGSNEDCHSGFCEWGKCRQPPAANGHACISDASCQSRTCIWLKCRPTNLGNGNRCDQPRQCNSGYCDSNVCNPHKMSDGSACVSDDRCSSGACIWGKCQAVNLHDGHRCHQPRQCRSGHCDWNVCKPHKLPDNSACISDDRCSSGVCAWAACKPVNLANGQRCDQPRQCTSGYCDLNVCRPQRMPDGSACVVGTRCESDICWLFKCQPGKLSVGKSCLLPKQCATSECAWGKCIHPQVGGKVFVDMLARMALSTVDATAHTVAVSMFPEANGHNPETQQPMDMPTDLQLRGSEEARKYTALMLAYNVAVYKFSEEEGNNMMPITPHREIWQYASTKSALNQDPFSYCSPVKDKVPTMFDETPGVETVSFQVADHDTQFAVYHWHRETASEHIVTLAFRGSEIAQSMVPGLHLLLKGLDDPDVLRHEGLAVEEMWRDWFGTDMNLDVVPDPFCKRPNVYLHKGFSGAYASVRERVKAALQAGIARAKAGSSSHPVKVFITGHSLGAAVASLASYDLHCNDFLADHSNVAFAGTVTFGHPFTFYNQASVQAYKEVVPRAERVRVLACSNEQVAGLDPKERKFRFCDGVGANWPGVGDWFPEAGKKGYLQPGDDFAAALVRDEGTGNKNFFDLKPDEIIHMKGKSSCWGAAPTWMCHLLDRYAQGVRRYDSFNGGICDELPDDKDEIALSPCAKGGGEFQPSGPPSCS